jgi:hypothetical protein
MDHIFNLRLGLIFSLNILPIIMIGYFIFLIIFSFVRYFARKWLITKFYYIYIFFYRAMMILLRTLFICTMITFNNIYAIDIFKKYINYLVMNIFVMEQSNIIVIYLKGRQLTTRRILYVLCYGALLVQSFYDDGSLPVLFFFVNYLCDLVKDIINIFYKKFIMADIINGIIKPYYLTILLLTTILSCDYRHAIILPTGIVICNLFDAKKRMITLSKCQ